MVCICYFVTFIICVIDIYKVVTGFYAFIIVIHFTLFKITCSRLVVLLFLLFVDTMLIKSYEAIKTFLKTHLVVEHTCSFARNVRCKVKAIKR